MTTGEMLLDPMGNPTGVVISPQEKEAQQAQEAKEAASKKFKSQFADALNMTMYERLKYGTNVNNEQDIVSSRTPDQVLDAFKKTVPAWGGVVDKIKADDQLKNSMHNALKKDPTMLAGLAGMTTGNGKDQKPADPKELEKFLSDPKNRKVLSQVLDKIADKDEFTFNDFNELYTNREDKKKSLAKLSEMGISPGSMISSQDMMKMLVSFLRNPAGFLNQLPGMLQDMGMIGPIQADAFRNSGAMKFAKGLSSAVLGPITGDRQGYGGHFANGIESLTRYAGSGEMSRDIDRYTGEADKKAAALKGADGNVKGDKINPTFAQAAQNGPAATPGAAPGTPTPQQQRAIDAYTP